VAGLAGPRNVLGNTGPVGTWSGFKAWTTRGVTTISNSSLDFSSERLWNSFPRTGIALIPGILFICSVTWLSISPAIAKLCPSRSSISDSARRVDSAGTVVPEMVIECAKSSELTSGLTFKWINPSDVSVGVKFNRMPNSLNWMVTGSTPRA